MSLDLSGRTVDQFIQMDNNYPTLLDYFKSLGELPSQSGQHDPDYPGLTHLSRSLKSLSQIGPIKKVPLPAELVEQFGYMQSYCEMGIFAEVGRAWLTIDKDIFVWTYEDGGDLAYFDGLSETILSVGLVHPKKSIFQPHIQFLLCLATPIEIVLLGVSFTRKRDDSPPYEEMHLLGEPLFTLATDNTHMVSINGTKSGRIFMGSKDGSVYELDYQAEDGWFRRKCRKINHSSSSLSFLVPQFINLAFYEEDPVSQIEIDETRNILYARSEKGGIQVFDLGLDGLHMDKVASLSPASIIDQAMNTTRNGDRSAFKAIIHISIIELKESPHIHLLAVTQSGVRFYFTTTYSLLPARPYSLTIVHVRFPPGHSVGGSTLQPNQVHHAHYKRGTVLLVSSKGDNDLLWVISNDTFPTQPRLIELHTVASITGKNWALQEVPNHQTFKNQPKAADSGVTEPPVLVTQHEEPQQKFIMVSPQGSHIITKLKPYEQLRQLLIDHQGPDCEAVKSFFSLLRETQACSVCLILACSRQLQDKNLVEWATLAFFMYGGDGPAMQATYPHHSSAFPGGMINASPISPSWNSPTPVAHSTALGQPLQASSPMQQSINQSTAYKTMNWGSPSVQAEQMQPGQALSPYQMHRQQQPQPLQGSTEGMFSAKHNGLYLYFGRIVRSIWNTRLVYDPSLLPAKSQPNLLVSAVSSGNLSEYLDRLVALKHFIEVNSQHLINPQPGRRKNDPLSPHLSGSYIRSEDIMHSEIQRRNQIEAQAQEKISICNLQNLIKQTIEVLGLWKILCDHQFHVVAASLAKDIQSQLRCFCFRDLIINGADICNALVTALIHHYLDDFATTDAISSRLRDVCPSIFRNEDAVFSKAHEKLVKVKTIKNKIEKEKILKEALQLCQEISPQLQLPAVCRLFHSVHYYEGVVDLCLGAADKRDPQGIASHFYRNREPPEDVQGFQAYANRMDCYKAILDTLGHLMSLSTSHPHSPSIPKSPGALPPPEPDTLAPEEGKSHLELVFKQAIESKDELFHTALYNWLIDNKLTDKLLEIKTPFLESFLKKNIERHPDNLAAIDLMWKFFEKNRNFSAAARILLKLAERHSPEVNLTQRLEFLSRAIICVKSSELRVTSSASEGEFLHELEEKMQVARIQLQIVETLSQRQAQQLPVVINAISSLNADLLDITRLYELYADPFDLYEAKLAIIHCAEHYDPLLVENLWKNIIDAVLQQSVGSSAETRMILLKNKITTLGRIYYSSQKYFPISFLIKYLEQSSCTAHFEIDWVFQMLLSIGVPFQLLLEQYHLLYRSRDPCWRTARQPHHLLAVLCQIITYFVDNLKIINQNERRSIASHCLDLVASYLLDLQTNSITTEGVQELTTNFRETQHKLERIV